MIELQMVNAKLVRKGLEDFTSEVPKVGRYRLYNTTRAIFKRAGEYPPKPMRPATPKQMLRWGGPKYSKYVRTYTLRKSRRIEKLDNGYILHIDPVDPRGVPYGELVFGNAYGMGQSRYTKHWTPIATITDEEVAKLPEEVIASLLIVANSAASRTH